MKIDQSTKFLYNNNNENHNNHTMSKEAFHRAQSLNTAHLPTNFDFYRPSEDDLTFDDEDASLAGGSPNNNNNRN